MRCVALSLLFLAPLMAVAALTPRSELLSLQPDALQAGGRVPAVPGQALSGSGQSLRDGPRTRCPTAALHKFLLF